LVSQDRRHLFVTLLENGNQPGTTRINLHIPRCEESYFSGSTTFFFSPENDGPLHCSLSLTSKMQQHRLCVKMCVPKFGRPNIEKTVPKEKFQQI
jgi:hypothetical protein